MQLCQNFIHNSFVEIPTAATLTNASRKPRRQRVCATHDTSTDVNESAQPTTRLPTGPAITELVISVSFLTRADRTDKRSIKHNYLDNNAREDRPPPAELSTTTTATCTSTVVKKVIALIQIGQRPGLNQMLIFRTLINAFCVRMNSLVSKQRDFITALC